jgi:hypothetical protein
MANPTNEWWGSTAHRPGIKGSETPVVDAVVMLGLLLDGGSGEDDRCQPGPLVASGNTARYMQVTV